MGEAQDEIRAAGGQVMAVFGYGAEEAAGFCGDHDVPFQCAGDPDVASYRAVGLESGSKRAVWGPRNLGPTLRSAFIKARGVWGPKGGDIYLPAATFVVDRHGEVVFAHYNERPADHPSMPDMLEAVRLAA